MLSEASWNGQAAGDMLHSLHISENTLDRNLEFVFWPLLV